MVVEPLPEVKEDLELSIVAKFLDTLWAQGIKSTEPTRGENWPDVEATVDAQPVGIEVVEVIDPKHAQKRATQEQYLDALLPLLQDLGGQLDQVVMTVVDGYQDPRWPRVSSAQGQRLVRHLAQKIHEEAGDLAAIGARGRYSRWDDFENSKLRLGLMATRGRRVPGSPGSGLDLRFSGAFPTNTATLYGLLAATIEGKLSKAYTRYVRGRLWLLAYAQDFSVVENVSIAHARHVLSSNKNQVFDGVWAFFPFPGQAGGQATQVFPW
jgi:hypothetical protein